MNIIIKKTCPACNKETSTSVSKAGYEKWQSGKLIQDCFPELSPTVRERLITGICSDDCWNKFLEV